MRVGHLLPFRRRRLPALWAPYRARRVGGFAPAEIRMMLWSGLLLGLLAWQISRPSPFSAGLGSASRWAVESARTEIGLLGSGVRVIDGDTFDRGGERIRIADIDTPEVNGRCAYETALAARATRRMRTLLAADPFELHPLPGGRDEDQYGRKLRIVTRDGQSLGDVLVSEGLARTWTGRREPWCV